MFDHRIENCQQFAHASDERKLWSLPCIAQPLVESSNDSITCAANQSCHVERCTYGGPTAPDRATPSQYTAVMVEWRDADQRCDLFTIELPEFRLNLANDAGFTNPANCSSFAEAGRDDPRFDTVFKDRGSNDLSRPVSCLLYDDAHTSN